MVSGLMFSSLHVAICVFLALVIFYALRMYYLSLTLKTTNTRKNYPVLRANIRIKHKFHFILFFPLSFLKVIKLIPDALAKKIMSQARLKMGLSELVDLVIDSCKGTCIDITNDEADLFFEIK